MTGYDVIGLVGLFTAAVAAGAINSVAGGGTLISFPSLVAFGETEVLSNATNTAALWPGSFSSALGYKKDTSVDRALLAMLIIPSIVGGLLGAVIFVGTPESVFRLVVPILILFATCLFAARKPISKKLTMKSDENEVSLGGRIWGFLFQLFVAAYGGYFGAGIGILMLGSLGVMGLRNIHVMNAMKTILAAMINVTAFIFFAVKGLVVWPLAALMAAGAILGGYVGARSAKHVNEDYLQLIIVTVGFVITAWFITRLL
jgi:uncharacterized membrane protein YfcA